MPSAIDPLAYVEYYPFGKVLHEYQPHEPYRYGYQGDYAEKDEETGWNSFQARMYDPVIGRWLAVDPQRQYPSPYTGMGNNPVNKVDPDGEWAEDPDIVYYDLQGNEVYRVASDTEFRTFIISGQEEGPSGMKTAILEEARMPGIVQGYEAPRFQQHDHMIAAQTYLFNRANGGHGDEPRSTSGAPMVGVGPSPLDVNIVKAMVIKESKAGNYDGLSLQNGKSDIMQSNVWLSSTNNDWNESKRDFGLQKKGSASPSQSVYAGIRILFQKGLTTYPVMNDKEIVGYQARWTGGRDWYKAVNKYNGGGVKNYASSIKGYVDSMSQGVSENYHQDLKHEIFLNSLEVHSMHY